MLREKMVALHPEGVDRNSSLISLFKASSVALHPEGVDRNIFPTTIIPGV